VVEHEEAAPAARGGRPWLALIVVVGVAVRLVWALYAAREPVGLQDPTLYTVFANSLASGEGYRLPDGTPTAYYPVGYPAALGAVFWLADNTPLPAGRVGLTVALNLVAAAVSLVLIHRIGTRLFDRRVGLAAAAGLALMPNLVFHTAVALTETLFNTIALAAVLLVVATDWRRRPLPALVGFGVLVGVAALVRPPSLLFVPVLVVAGWRAGGWGWREAMRSFAVPTVAAAAVILPWTLRNIDVMEAPILLSSNVGDNLCIGHNPDATGAFQFPPSCLDGYDHLVRPEYEVARDTDGRAKALRFIREHPAEQLRLVPLRAFHTFRNDTDALEAVESYGKDPFIGHGLRTVLGIASNVTFFASLVLGVAAAVVLRGRRGRRDPGRTFVVLAAISLAATPLAFFGDVRFHVPVVPFLVLGTAALVVWVVDRRAGAHRPRAPAPG
jgi:hypothetical protein